MIQDSRSSRRKCMKFFKYTAHLHGVRFWLSIASQHPTLTPPQLCITEFACSTFDYFCCRILQTLQSSQWRRLGNVASAHRYGAITLGLMAHDTRMHAVRCCMCDGAAGATAQTMACEADDCDNARNHQGVAVLGPECGQPKVTHKLMCEGNVRRAHHHARIC